MKRILVALLLIGVVGYFGNRFFSSQKTDGEIAAAIIEILTKRDLLDQRFEPLVQYTLKEFKADFRIDRNFVVNASGKGDEIAVLVVSPKAYETLDGSDSAQRIILGSKNNFLSVSPNIILIDARLAGLMFVQAMNDAIALVQIDGAIRERGGEAGDQLALVTGPIGNVLSLNNIKAVYRDGNTKIVDEGISAFNDVTKALDGDNPLSDAFAVALYPILLHELGHLTGGQGGGFFPEFEKAIASTELEAIREEEQRADRFAAQQIQFFLGGDAAEVQRREVLILSSASFLRQIVVSQNFENFRGLAAADHYVELSHWPCTGPNGKGQLARGYADIEAVRKGVMGVFPLLTPDEFKTMSTSSQAAFGSSHPSQSMRSRIFVESFKNAGFGLDRQILQLNLLDALNAGSAEDYGEAFQEYFRHDFGALPATNISEKDLLALFPAETMTAQESISCPETKCYVFKFSHNLGFGEAYIRDSSVVMATFTLPLFGRAPGNSPRQTDMLEYMLTAAVGIKIAQLADVGSVAAGDQPREPLVRQMLQFRDDVAKCNYGSLNIVGSTGVALTGGVLDNNNWVKFRLRKAS